MKTTRHSFDIVFSLILFCLFAVCAVLLVLLGARIYGVSAAGTNRADTAVLLSYLTEKLRGCSPEGVTVRDGDCLLIETDVDGQEYITWIYTEDGCLKETLLQEGREPVEGAGSTIGKIKSFQVEKTEEGLLEFRVTDSTGTEGYRCYALSDPQDETAADSETRKKN